MAVEKKIKQKMKKWEEMAQLIMEIDDKIDELHSALDDLYDLREKASDKLFDYEDYFAEHYTSLQVKPIKLINEEVVNVIIAHNGTTTFAVLEGEIGIAKLSDGDIYDPQAGELIATQKVINKVLARDYGVVYN